jgi:predicted nucleic acid-binding protein
VTINTQPDIYVDTDLIVNANIRGLSHSEASRRALGAVLHSESLVHFSIILRMEYIQAIRNLALRSQLPQEVRQEFNLDNWENDGVRQRWMDYGLQQLESLIADLPAVVELPLTSSIVYGAAEYMTRYGLRSQDAVHLATALHYEIPVFWTCDDHFARVDDLSVEIIRDEA